MVTGSAFGTSASFSADIAKVSDEFSFRLFLFEVSRISVLESRKRTAGKVVKETPLSELSCSRNFERDALPHLNSAYDLARWLTRNDQDAEDIVQEAYLRAFRFYRSFRGSDARPWLLKIVRNVYYTWSRQNAVKQSIDFDQNLAGRDSCFENPEELLIRNANRVLLRTALEVLPTPWRKILILRELQGMSYKEISTTVGAPVGTVMSRLSRARARLSQSVADLMIVRTEPRAEV